MTDHVVGEASGRQPLLRQRRGHDRAVGGNTIQSIYIGTNVAGTAAANNNVGISIVSAGSNNNVRREYAVGLNASRYGEGQTYLGSLTTDANGSFSGRPTLSGLAVGDKLTATATDDANNTSEFGGRVAVFGPPPVVGLGVSVAPDRTVLSGTDVAYTFTFSNSGARLQQCVPHVAPAPQSEARPQPLGCLVGPASLTPTECCTARLHGVTCAAGPSQQERDANADPIH